MAEIDAREQVMTAVYALLQGLSGVSVYRNRGDPIEEMALPAINVVDGDHDMEPASMQESRYTMTFDVLIWAGATGGIVPATRVSAIWAQIVQALGANSRLGGKVSDLEEIGLLDTEIETDERGRAILINTVSRWQASFSTPPGDPYTLLLA
jgi:hypothetical protein